LRARLEAAFQDDRFLRVLVCWQALSSASHAAQRITRPVPSVSPALTFLELRHFSTRGLQGDHSAMLREFMPRLLSNTELIPVIESAHSNLKSRAPKRYLPIPEGHLDHGEVHRENLLSQHMASPLRASQFVLLGKISKPVRMILENPGGRLQVYPTRFPCACQTFHV
jgi:hypothetical protein